MSDAYNNYLSVFSWRYGSAEMRKIFSEKHKLEIWRKIWVAIASVQHEAGLVSSRELKDLIANESNLDIDRILEIEKDSKHDVVAAIREYAEKAKLGGGKIHLGATSMDIVDNADVYRIHEATGIVISRIKKVLSLFCEKIEKYADFPCIGYTHLQPAEPTTVGYRLAFYAQDIYNSLIFLRFVQNQFKAKGVKGAVGTGASYIELLTSNKLSFEAFEKRVMGKLGLESTLITTQVYPRQYDYFLLSALSAVGIAFAKFAGDLRILQSPNFGEWSEPFGKNQVGSSAMPFKKNPVSSENICSLARFVSNLPQIAGENAALSYLERTLDDSANKRIIIPEAFLATDQILISAEKNISGLVINEKRITYNLNLYAPFAATESIMIAAVKKGADRQKMHEIIRNISLAAWQEIQSGNANPMKDLLINDKNISAFLNKSELMLLMDVKNHIGDASKRALKLVKQLAKYEK